MKVGIHGFLEDVEYFVHPKMGCLAVILLEFLAPPPNVCLTVLEVGCNRLLFGEENTYLPD